MTNADSLSSNTYWRLFRRTRADRVKPAEAQNNGGIARALKSLLADFIFIVGLGLICWGVFKYSVPAGLIVTGIAVIILARAITPEDKKKN